jgi:hypothetical protein
MSDENKCSCENPAEVTDIDPAAGPAPRVAEVEVCDEEVCEVGHFLVRGDHVSLISTEQARRMGEKRVSVADGESAWRDRNGRQIVADIPLPPTYVLVHDAVGRLLEKCDIYVLKWRSSRRQMQSDMHQSDLRAAENYFGPQASIRGGFVEIPRGSWAPVTQVRFIRYRRFGFRNAFEHRYDPPVKLLSTSRPLAWRLPLPDGCVIDSRGFVRP